MGSILKSVAAKSAILELVADVVNRLCNHTLKTLGSDELQLIEKHTADAVAVGFNLEWLQQRVNKVVAASKYKVRLMELDELDQQIYAARKSLMEMELRHTVWMEEVADIKDEIEGKGFGGSSLGLVRSIPLSEMARVIEGFWACSVSVDDVFMQ
ncbi:hypothetical protein F0562_019068 [Nyssa sinensis]|uniref:Uncharacterized protein n=1 Tax=Nyssa sinensis TaxID=561372 RepID=A0A5J4ZD91_9ASTE|nr:hypothetical protein F0562_019068 [Nyssa sinensis]